MKKIFLSITLVLAFSIVACKNNSNSETPKEMTPQKQITKNKKSFVSLFEIPATDI